MEFDIKEIDIDRIEFAEVNRDKIDPAKLKELAETIKEVGILNDPIVTPRGKSAFECVAGERRLRAAKIAGLKRVKVKVVDGSPESIVAAKLIDNIQRENLTPWEEAAQLIELRDQKPDRRVEDLATLVGRTPEWIACRIAFAGMAESLKSIIVEQDWPLPLMPLLARVPADQHDELAADIKETQRGAWSVWVSGGKRDQRRVPSRSELEAFLLKRQRELKAAPWKLGDAELLPDAGSCNDCPKRSAASTLLFPEAATAAKDRCLDPACWARKETAMIMLSVAKLDPKEKPVFLQGHSVVSKERLKALGVKPDKVESIHTYDKCKKTDKGARPAVVVEPADGCQVVYVRSYRDAVGSRNSNGKKERAVDQATGKKAEPTTKERLGLLKAKRMCLAVELWSEKLAGFEPSLLVAARIAAVVGTSGRETYLGNGKGWDGAAKLKEKEIAAKLWGRVVGVLTDRLKRWGSQDKLAAKLYSEADAVADLLGEADALGKCYDDAVVEIRLPKVLASAGVVDPDA